MSKEHLDQSRDGWARGPSVDLSTGDRHSDSVSETDSETQPGYQIYTPTSSSSFNDNRSAAGTDSLADKNEEDPLLAEEKAPLLSDGPPPQYEDEDALKKRDDGSGADDAAPLELGDSGIPNCKRGPRRCRRRGSRKICLLVCVKILAFVILVLCLLFDIAEYFGIWPRKHRHHDCTPDHEHVPSPPNRDIVIDRGTRPIWGRWPLYDLLSLTTTSGSIAVIIEPQPADPDHPDRPARLVLKTTSGSIVVSFSAPHAASIPENEMKMDLAELAMSGEDGYSPKDKDDDDEVSSSRRKKHRKCKNKNKNKNSKRSSSSHIPPPRPYEIEIQTESGTISGRFLFSTYASLQSGSGSINAMLIPVVYPDLPSNVTIKTRTVTGSQYVRLTEPFEVSAAEDEAANEDTSQPEAEKKKKKKKKKPHHHHHHHCPQHAATAHSSHTSAGSGSMHIAYPRVWAGEVHAVARGGGRICLDGKGLQVYKQGGQFADGFKEADGDDDDDRRVWWGSRGDMNVSLAAEGSGSITFFVG